MEFCSGIKKNLMHILYMYMRTHTNILLIEDKVMKLREGNIVGVERVEVAMM